MSITNPDSLEDFTVPARFLPFVTKYEVKP